MATSEPQPLSISAIQLACGDLLNRFLRYSSKSSDLNHALHLARALGQFFAFCSVEVLWLPNEQEEGGGYSSCGACWEPSGEVFPLNPQKELRGRIDFYRGRVKPRYIGLELSDEDDPVSIYVISDSPSGGLQVTKAERLWLIVKSPKEEAGQEVVARRNKVLRRDSSFLEMLYITFIALHKAPCAGELGAEIRSFVGQVSMGPLKRLVEANELIAKVSDIWMSANTPSSLRLAQAIAESVTQSLIGNGVDVDKRLLDGDGSEANGFVLKLRTFLRKKMVAKTADAGATEAKLAALCHTVQAIAADKVICEGCSACRTDKYLVSERGLMELLLLADWTELHQLAQEQSRKLFSERERLQDIWYPRAFRTFDCLKKLLHDRFRDASRIPSAWLRLWFCQDLLFQAYSAIAKANENNDSDEDVAVPEEWNDWRFCVHLAYVIRESLRVFVYGHRTDYIFRAPALAEALRALVEQHALHVLHLPSDPDIRSLLFEISSMRSSVGYFYVAGHLQHVLEIYIVGQFVCDLRIEMGKADIWTAEQILASRSAWKPRELSTGEFRRAFGLAALFHDVGRLLLPRWRPTAEGLLQVDKVLIRNLAGVENNLLDSLAGLLSQCAKDLEAEGYYDPTSERAVGQWVEDRVERREVDFAVVSAWFLHRLCQNIQGLQGETVRQAVRAILFHQMVTQCVEVDRDPAAALLILCDQLFAWNSSKIWMTPGETGHSVQAIAADIRPQPPLFEFLELRGLQPEPDERPDLEALQPLKFRVQPEATGKAKGFWPHIVVTLHEPEARQVPLIWIGLAQSLCRIKPSKSHQWAPWVTIWSQIRSGGQVERMFDVLEKVVSEDRSTLRGAFNRFIQEHKHWVGIDETGHESIEIRPLGSPLHQEDLSLLFPELERLLEKLIAKREGQNVEIMPEEKPGLGDSTQNTNHR